jgi:hypothetical protein
MMNKSLRARGRESSHKTFYGFLSFPAGAAGPPREAKKRAAVSGGFEVDNREASNRVDRSHSVSKEDDQSHKRESLIDRKRGIFFSLHLPCRPLADISIVMPGLVPGIHMWTAPWLQGFERQGESGCLRSYVRCAA